MVHYIKGEVLEINFVSNHISVVLFTGGLGYGVCVPLGEIFEVGEEVELFTSFQVREDSQTLYGFRKKEQKDMFENILHVSGVGPKVSLSLVSEFTPKEFRNILAKGDYKTLSKVKGLGQKGAKKIVLELQGTYVEDEKDTSPKVLDELKEALAALGFQGKERDELLKKGRGFLKENEDASVESLISFVLKS